jgi:NADH dehydrogenase FAD-containing subunit
MPDTVVILGGGVGGLVTANELRKALPKAHHVVLALGSDMRRAATPSCPIAEARMVRKHCEAQCLSLILARKMNLEAQRVSGIERRGSHVTH